MKSNSLPEPRNALLVVASTAVLAVGAVCQTSPVVCWQDELVGTSAAVTHWHHGGLVSIDENDGFILDCKSITSNRLWSYRWKGHSYSLLKRGRGEKIYKNNYLQKTSYFSPSYRPSTEVTEVLVYSSNAVELYTWSTLSDFWRRPIRRAEILSMLWKVVFYVFYNFSPGPH